MEGRGWFRVLAVFVLIGLLAVVGVTAYNAGVATHIQVPANGNGQVPFYPFYGFGFWSPFWFLGPLIGLFVLVLVIRALLFMVFGPRWGRAGRMHRGWGRWDDEGGVPPMFKEWHDRAHGRASETESTNKS